MIIDAIDYAHLLIIDRCTNRKKTAIIFKEENFKELLLEDFCVRSYQTNLFICVLLYYFALYKKFTNAQTFSWLFEISFSLYGHLSLERLLIFHACFGAGAYERRGKHFCWCTSQTFLSKGRCYPNIVSSHH